MLIQQDYSDSKVREANMGPIWGRQVPGGPHVGPMNFAIRVVMPENLKLFSFKFLQLSMILYFQFLEPSMIPFWPDGFIQFYMYTEMYAPVDS